MIDPLNVLLLRHLIHVLDERGAFMQDLIDVLACFFDCFGHL